ncbi:MAG: helix-turn-helix transcriptional regulator [Pseudonocardiales bacterium]
MLGGADVTDDDVSNALYEATDGDIELSVIDGLPYTSFTRTAESYQRAVLNAVKQVENADVGVRVVRIQTDELLTISEIADRTGRTPESIRLLVSGERGPGNFPGAESRMGARNRLWRWSTVVEWFQAYDPEAVADYLASVPDPEFVVSLNAALALRDHLPKVTNAETRNEVTQLARLDLAM